MGLRKWTGRCRLTPPQLHNQPATPGPRELRPSAGRLPRPHLAVPPQEAQAWPHRGLCRGPTLSSYILWATLSTRGWVLSCLTERGWNKARDWPGLRPCRVAQPGPPSTHLCVPQGELTTTTDMEDLCTALFYDTVPDTWVARAYPSMMGLAAWYADLLLRIRVRTGLPGAPPQSVAPPQSTAPPSPGGPCWPGLCQSRAGRAWSTPWTRAGTSS